MFESLTIKEVKEHIGQLLRVLRQREDMTQEALAEKLGMSRLTVQNLESGRNPTLDTLLKALQYFGQLEALDKHIANETDNNNQESLY